MPGLYLLIILISGTCIALIDRRWRLAAWSAPGRTAATVAIGVAFFLAWDAVGIVTGVFLKGGSPALLGIDLAPHLPLEEVFFLTFLSYLSLVLWSASHRLLTARTRARAGREREET